MADVFISYSRKDIQFAQRLHYDWKPEIVSLRWRAEVPNFSVMVNGQVVIFYILMIECTQLTVR